MLEDHRITLLITLPNGKCLAFSIRENAAFWNDEENYLLEKFKDKIPTSRIQGRHFVDIDDHAKDRLTVLGNFDELDVFAFYGDSMKDMIKLYTDISDKSMLLPKRVYGLTYGAHIHQNQFEIMNDMMKFREKGIPCDNVSLEPGWMEKHYDYSFDKKWDCIFILPERVNTFFARMTE